MTEAELTKVIEALHVKLADGMRTAHRWFWAAIGVALGAGLNTAASKVVEILLEKHIK